jgi:hypothetical protein
MGRKAKNKQADVKPLPGSAPDRRTKPGKKRSKSGKSDVQGLKSTGPGSKSARQLAKKAIKKRVKAVDAVDEDSDLDEALQPG